MSTDSAEKPKMSEEKKKTIILTGKVGLYTGFAGFTLSSFLLYKKISIPFVPFPDLSLWDTEAKLKLLGWVGKTLSPLLMLSFLTTVGFRRSTKSADPSKFEDSKEVKLMNRVLLNILE